MHACIQDGMGVASRRAQTLATTDIHSQLFLVGDIDVHINIPYTQSLIFIVLPKYVLFNVITFLSALQTLNGIVHGSMVKSLI